MNFEPIYKTSQKQVQQHHPGTPAGQGSFTARPMSLRSPRGTERGEIIVVPVFCERSGRECDPHCSVTNQAGSGLLKSALLAT